MHHVKPYAQNARAKPGLSKMRPQSRTIHHTAAPLQIFAKRSTPPPAHCLAAKAPAFCRTMQTVAPQRGIPKQKTHKPATASATTPRKPLFSVSAGLTPHGATAQTLARPTRWALSIKDAPPPVRRAFMRKRLDRHRQEYPATRYPLQRKAWRGLPSLTYEAQGDSLLDYNLHNYHSQLRGRHVHQSR